MPFRCGSNCGNCGKSLDLGGGGERTVRKRVTVGASCRAPVIGDSFPPLKLVVSVEGSTMGTADDRLLELTILVAPARSSTFASQVLPVQFSFSLILSSMTDGCSGALLYHFFESPVSYVGVTKFSAGPDQTRRSCYAQLIGCGFPFGDGSSIPATSGQR